jgi:Domain of unknown function (DUF4365)
MDRGKRRSLGQRIGTKGEKRFALWATDRRLSTNKVDDDYGVDFLCQILRSVGKNRSEEATGALLAVQVKATDGRTRPRVTLDRQDAVNLLRQTQTTALVAVGPEEPYVHFLFLDQAFIDRLSLFLASPNSTASVRLDEMKADSEEFDRQLSYLSQPGTQHRLRIYKAEKDIVAAIPGSSLSVQHLSGGGIAVVDVPCLPSALHVNQEHVRR